MSIKEDRLVRFFSELMERRRVSASRLASDLGISHAAVSRWLARKDTPSPRSCQKVAEYSGVPIMSVLSLAGYLPSLPDEDPAKWPEFREYAKGKYPKELDEDLIMMIEDLIERRRNRHAKAGGSKDGSAHSG